MDKPLPDWMKFLGIDAGRISHKERLVSALGGFLGIGGILLITTHYIHSGHAALIVASMGASAVLLFAVPHGTLSQPWPVFGGHIVSAFIGVTCAQLIPHEITSAALAVGLAIGAMHYLRCIHPPGGATAISAVIGGEAVHELGYSFLLTPVLLNVLVILLIALLFNFLFGWRRYPVYLQNIKRAGQREQTPEQENAISHEDFVFALSQMDSFIDINEDDLLHIYNLATGQSSRRHMDLASIRLGHYYSNGNYGDTWSVRQVVDESEEGDIGTSVIYKTVAGRGRRTSGVCSKEEFARWARNEVYRDEENWRKVESKPS